MRRPVKQFLELLNNPEVQTFLKLFNDNCLATSDLKILKRLSKIESMLGLNDIEEEEHREPTIQRTDINTHRKDREPLRDHKRAH